MPQLLGGAPSQKEQQIGVDIEQSKKISELIERTRLLEERLKQSRDRIQAIDETNMTKVKELRDSINGLNNEISSVRKDIDEIKEIVRRIAKDMSSTARVSDVRVLEKYIGMMDITRLVSKEEVLRIIKDELSKSKKSKD
jgi:uncharacterized protein (DUF342 family)